MVVEQFNSILKKEKVGELILFLRSLQSAEKKELASALKPLAKEYLEYKVENSLIGHSAYKQKATKPQIDILYATAFATFNRKEYQKFDSFGQFVGNTIIDNILPWYCPDWYSDVINDLTKRDWMPWNFDYQAAMNLVDKGYLNPTDELIARLIPQMIFERDVNHKHNYRPENLERRAITLEKHIWLIFQFETTINFSDRYLQFQNSGKDVRHWMEALKTPVTKGLVDRHRILQESILATGRNFNKSLSGWFVDLFEFLEPTHAELLALQPELINALSSPHSKAINAALDGIKEVVEGKEFNVRALLENTPILLSNETKTVVSKTLSLLEKILRKTPSLREEICISVCQAFIQNDEEIQKKASKLLLKYHKGELPSVTNELGKYADSLLMSSKKLLAEFTAGNEQQVGEFASASLDQNDSFIPIEDVDTLDGLIFLASQAFDNNDSLHIDLLPATLVNLQDQVTGANLHKFEPALQRAYTFVVNDWTSTMGYLDHLLATFFIDVTKLFVNRFPHEGKSLQKIHETFLKKDSDNKAKWSWYNSRISELQSWSVFSKDTTYIIHKAILLKAYEKIKNSNRLPLLSTPTHQYGFVDPMKLVTRLSLYQDKNILPDNYDFQLALSRVAPFHIKEALIESKTALTGEPLRIIEFLLEPTARPTPPYTTPSLWFMAGVAKSPHQTYPEFSSLFYSSLPKSTFTGDVPWKSFVENYKTTQYNYQKKTSEEIPATRNVLRLTLNPTPSIWQEPEEKKDGLLGKLTKLLTSPKKNTREETFVLYEFLSLKAKFLSAEHNDIQRFVLLFPSNPNPLLTLVTARSLEFSTFASETDKRMVTKLLETLINLRFEFSEITYLFIATCLLTSDKTIRSFAAEMWINGVKRSDVDSAYIGKIIGIHLSGEYAPMKRLTDLISSNLLKISARHNRALESLLTSIIEHIQSEPPTGTKRLLELYSETLALNDSTVASEKAKQNLHSWSTSPSLRKIIATLIG